MGHHPDLNVSWNKVGRLDHDPRRRGADRQRLRAREAHRRADGLTATRGRTTTTLLADADPPRSRNAAEPGQDGAGDRDAARALSRLAGSIVHTGQHYDRLMFEVFLEELGVPEPDHLLGVGSGGHAEQIAQGPGADRARARAERPDLVIVPATSTRPSARRSARRSWGSGSPTWSRAFGASTARCPRRRTGLRTDHLSQLLCFLHSDEAIENLRAEGVEESRMKFVGNTMIDTLVALEERIRERGRGRGPRRRARELPAGHAAPAGPRRRAAAGETMRRLSGVARELPVVFPVHPRTRKMLGGAEYPGRDADRPGRLPRLPLAGGRGGRRADRLRGDPGGDDLPRDPVLHASRQHRAAGHDPGRDEHPARPRPGADLGRSRAPASRPRGAPAREASEAAGGPPLWDGRAAERVADVLADW